MMRWTVHWQHANQQSINLIHQQLCFPHDQSDLYPYKSQFSPFRLSTHDSHVAFPRELTTASRLPHSNKTEQQGGNHNPSTTPTLLQPMPACAAVAYMAFTMHARVDMDAVQCY